MITSLPAKLSLSGHDAYCHVCWEDFYALWVAKESPPNHLCPLGAAVAHECANAMSRASMAAFFARLRARAPDDPQSSEEQASVTS